MKANYSLGQRLVSYFLLLSLMLQSCSNPPISPVLPSTTVQDTDKKQISSFIKQEVQQTRQLLEEIEAPIEEQLGVNTPLQVTATLEDDSLLHAASSFTEQTKETVTSTDLVAPSSVLPTSTTPLSKLNSQPAVTVEKDVKRPPSSIQLAKKQNKYKIRLKALNLEEHIARHQGKYQHTDKQETENSGYQLLDKATADTSDIVPSNISIDSEKILEQEDVVEQLQKQCFITKDSYQVAFEKLKDNWFANVQPSWTKGLRGLVCIPVYLEPGVRLSTLLKLNEFWQKRHIHVMFAKEIDKKQTPIGVYIGVQGLLGGGKTPLHEAFELRNIMALMDERCYGFLNSSGCGTLYPLSKYRHYLNEQDEMGITPLHRAVCLEFRWQFQSHKNLINEMVSLGADINATDHKKQTPLHWAVNNMQGDGEIIKYGRIVIDYPAIIRQLVELGANINAKDGHGYAPLHYAVEKNNQYAASLLVGLEADIEIQDINGNTPLHLAVQLGNMAMVEHLISLGVYKNKQNNQSNTPLHMAITGGQTEIAKKLIDLGASKNTEDKYGNEALHLAIEQSNSELVSYLIQKGIGLYWKNKLGLSPVDLASVKGRLDYVQQMFASRHSEINNISWQDGLTHLHRAVQRRDLALLKVLLNLGANKDEQEQPGKIFPLSSKDKQQSPHRTPLHFAVEQEDIAIIKCLIAAGANKSIPDRNGKTPIQYALEKAGRPLFRQLLNALQIDINEKDSNGHTLLHRAIAEGNEKLAEQLMVAGADINIKDKHGNTPLHLAIQQKNLSLLKQMLAAEASKSTGCINTKNNDQQTPLHLAVIQGDTAIIAGLVLEKADKVAKDKDGNTPLHVAVLTGNTAVVEQLISSNVDKDIKNNRGETPLHIALQQHSSKDKLIELLRALKVNIQAKDSNGHTLLHTAILEEDERLVSLLLNSTFTVDKNAKNNFGKSPLHIAAEKGNVRLVNLLVALKVDIDIQDNQGETPLHKAIQLGNAEIINQLINAGANKDSCNNYGHTPLHLSVVYNQLQAAIQLRAKGALLCPMDQEGNTPLHLAIYRQHPEFIKYLSQVGSDLHFKNKLGLTPIDFASQNGYLTYVRQMILASHTGINNIGVDGLSHLHRAVQHRDLQLAKLLLILGADKDIKEKKASRGNTSLGRTPIHIAVEQEDIEMIGHLVDIGADKDITDSSGQTILQYALQKINRPNFQKLLSALGININNKNRNQQTLLHQSILEGNHELAKQLIAAGADIQAKNKQEYTPLHLAAIGGHLELVALLIAKDKAKNPNPKDKDGNTPLHLAVMQGKMKIIRQLIRLGADINEKNNDGDTALHLAVKKDDEKMVDLLIGLKADRQVKDKQGFTLLHVAVKGNKPKMVDHLIALGLATNAQDHYGQTPLHIAVKENHLDMVGRLIKLNFDKNAIDHNGSTLLHIAVKDNNFEMVGQLIKTGIAINQKDHNGNTPLHIAVQEGNQKIFDRLLKANADRKIKNREGLTLLHIAVKSSKHKMVHRLITLGVVKNAQDNQGNTPLHLAVQEGNADMVDQLVALRADMQVKNKQGFTGLHIAVQANNARMVRQLIALSFDKDAKDIEGNTALHIAVKQGNIQIVNQLVDLGVNINSQDYAGDTPLHLAVKEGNAEMAGLLLALGANKDVQNYAGNAILYMAVKEDNSEMVDQLIQAGADRNVSSKDGCTLLHTAVTENKPRIIHHLIALGLDKNAQDNDGNTPLHLAVKKGNAEMLYLLVSLRADRRAKNKQGFTCLHLAVKENDLDMVRQLVALNFNKNTKDNQGNTPLHIAVEEGKEEIAKHLVQAGANLHIVNKLGLTPIDLAATSKYIGYIDLIFSAAKSINTLGKDGLTHLHRAVQRKDVKLIEQLIKCQADVTATDKVGKTPLHYAASEGHTKLVKILSAALKPKVSLSSLFKKNSSLIDILDNQGQTPLHLAIAGGHIGTVKSLLQQKASLYVKDKQGITPLQKALDAKQTALIKLVVNIPDCSPLHWAVEHNNIGLIKQLLVAGIDINTMDMHGKTALYMAFERGNLELTKQLVALGAAANATDSVGRTLLHHTIINGHLEVAKALLAAGAKINVSDNQGFTELHLAAQYNQPEIARYLITRGAVIDLRDHQQRTALHWAAYHGHAEVAIVLIQAGADLQAFDQQGYTPLYYPLQQGKLGLVELIAAASEHKIQVSRCAYRARTHVTLPTFEQQESTDITKRAKKKSPTSQFISRFLKDLPIEQRAEFEKTIVPLLKKHLAGTPRLLQNNVIQYFENQGCFYPSIFQEYKVEDWVKESLILDITKEALSKEDEVEFAKFIERLNAATQSYKQGELEKLLGMLREKQLVYQFDLAAIADVLTYLIPFSATQALALLEVPDTDWLSSLRLAWLGKQVKTLQHFTPSQRRQISYAGTIFPCKPELLERFIVGLQQEKDFSKVEDFFAFITKNPVSETTLLMAFYQKPKEVEASAIKAWKHYIACELLKNALAQRYASHSTHRIEKQLATLLDNHWLYEELYATLFELVHKNYTDVATEAQCLSDILDLLIEYGVDSQHCRAVLQIIQTRPCHEWEKVFHPHAIAATFGRSHERSATEIIDFIAENSPQTPFVNDKSALESSYQAVLAAYQRTATLAPENKQIIAKWDKAAVIRWAERAKGCAAICNMSADTQHEALAVIKRAVKLTHGHEPRATQLLALLTFLNHVPGKGRLSQINTGEGKSLIVAMLASMHALKGKKVDVVTTSTELSIPEVAKQTKFFELLGLSVGENSDDNQKKDVYTRDIVYGTASNFQGDILKTEFSGKDIRGSRGFSVVIVDEVDSMLFDSRHASIRLSGQTPAMHHLELLLASVYSQVSRILRHLIEKDGITYYIHEDFEVVGDQITTFSGNQLQMEPVSDKEQWITMRTQQHIENLLRPLTGDELQEWREYKALNEKIVRKGFKAASEEYEVKRKKYEELCKKLGEELKNLPWEKKGRSPVIEIPNHLREFAHKQIPLWIRSAIQAICFFKKELHYDVVKERIVPIDYDNTGVLQNSMVWSDGLAQMLQMKEGLRVEAENISTNFISIPEFFKRYGSFIYGLTGTLGNAPTHQFLTEVYGVDKVIMPPYKHIPIAANIYSKYSCKELPPIIVPNAQAWQESIIRTTLSKARNHRAVLIICKYIDQVNKLAKQLSTHYDETKIFTYTGQERFDKKSIEVGEIIIATNIAGRGTDITTKDDVEKNGGLHVCITFLPDTYRVELQNAGRTARQGKQGTAQLVIQDSNNSSIEDLRSARDDKEETAITRAKDDVYDMLLRDRLFNRFCALESELLPNVEYCTKEAQLKKLWAYFQTRRDKLFAPGGKLDCTYEYEILKEARSILYDRVKQQTPTAAELRAIKQDLDTTKRELYKKHDKAALVKKLEKELVEQTCSLAKGNFPVDVIERFRNGYTTLPNGGELATKHDWGKHERTGVEETWGLWLQHALKDKPEDAVWQEFNTFENTIRERAKGNALIRNPYYYVLKGNDFLFQGYTGKAEKAYNKAIELDPLHSVNAHYKRAWALLKPKENKDNILSAKRSLKHAKVLISTHHKPNLISFNAMVAQTGAKPQLLAHIQHQVDILIKQESYIDAALREIKKAKKENWDIKLTEVKTLEQVFDDADPGENRGPAISKANINGLSHMFVITAKQPFPWKSIIALAIIGIAQVAAGVLVCACTGGGMGLISEGISDLLATFKAVKSGTFSWAQWGVQKAISLAVSIISSGWQGIKDGFKNLTETVKKVGDAGYGIAQEGMKLAINKAAVELGKGVVKEVVNSAVNHISEKYIIDNLEGYIERKVIKKLEKRLLANELLSKALSLDVKNKRNDWQQIFIQEGMKLLHKPDSKLQQFLKGTLGGLLRDGLAKISQQTAAEGGKGAQLFKHAFQAGSMAKALFEILTITDEFFTKFAEEIELKYKADIEKAAQVQAEKEKVKEEEKGKEKEEAHTTATEQVIAPPEVEQGEIKTARVGSGVSYNSQVESKGEAVREYYHGAASSKGSLSKVLGGSLKAKITNKIQGELIQPVTSAIVSAGTEKLCEGLTQNVDAALEAFRAERHTHDIGDKVATTTEDEKQGQAGESTGKKLDAHSEQKAKAVAEGKRGDITDVALLAKAAKRPIIIYKNGKIYNIIGKDLPGEPISLSHSSEGVGHWEPIDKNIQVTVSGENNCLYDAVAAQMSSAEREELGVKNGQDFRQHVVKEIQNNATITQQFMAQAAQLSYLKPAAMMEGGWRWRVDMDTPNGVGAIVKVDDEGGADTQYYEYERIKKDAAGNPVLDADGNPQKETVVTTIAGVSLNMIPVVETDHSTACLTHIPQANPEDTYNGVMLFPKGPGCNIDGTNRRLEVGTYKLKLSPNSGVLYPGALRFLRDKPVTGGNPLLWDQARVIHNGEHFGNTSGCGIIGSKYILNQKFVIENDRRNKYGNIITRKGTYVDTVVRESKKTKKELESKVKAYGVDKEGNCSLQAVMGKSFDEAKKESKEEKKEN
ncbi:MAG: ankyrin repeat domain-containing protein [Candidatus Amoebophilus sp.]